MPKVKAPPLVPNERSLPRQLRRRRDAARDNSLDPMSESIRYNLTRPKFGRAPHEVFPRWLSVVPRHMSLGVSSKVFN